MVCLYIAAAFIGVISLHVYLWFNKPWILLKYAFRLVLRLTGCQTKYVSVEDGLTLSYAERGVPVEGKSTLVLIHGYMLQKEAWSQLLYHIPRDFCHVIAVDLPGHGDSTVPPDSLIGLDASVSAIHKLLSMCGLGNKPIHIAGMSLGGLLSGMYAVKYPEHVTHVSIMCPPVNAPKVTDISRQLKSGDNPFLVTSTSGLFDLFKMMSILKIPKNEQLLKGLLELRLKRHEFFQAFLANTFRQISGILEETVGNISVPCHVVWGSDDDIIDVSGAEVLKSKLRNCVQYDIIANCGHLLMNDQPKHLANCIIAYRLAIPTVPEPHGYVVGTEEKANIVQNKEREIVLSTEQTTENEQSESELAMQESSKEEMKENSADPNKIEHCDQGGDTLSDDLHTQDKEDHKSEENGTESIQQRQQDDYSVKIDKTEEKSTIIDEQIEEVKDANNGHNWLLVEKDEAQPILIGQCMNLESTEHSLNVKEGLIKEDCDNDSGGTKEVHLAVEQEKRLKEGNSERNSEMSDVMCEQHMTDMKQELKEQSPSDRAPEKVTAVIDEQESEINIAEQSHSQGNQVAGSVKLDKTEEKATNVDEQIKEVNDAKNGHNWLLVEKDEAQPMHDQVEGHTENLESTEQSLNEKESAIKDDCNIDNNGNQEVKPDAKEEKPLEEDDLERNSELFDVKSSSDRAPEKLAAVMDEQEPDINIVEQSHSQGNQVAELETAEKQEVPELENEMATVLGTEENLEKEQSEAEQAKQELNQQEIREQSADPNKLEYCDQNVDDKTSLNTQECSNIDLKEDDTHSYDLNNHDKRDNGDGESNQQTQDYSLELDKTEEKATKVDEQIKEVNDAKNGHNWLLVEKDEAQPMNDQIEGHAENIESTEQSLNEKESAIKDDCDIDNNGNQEVKPDAKEEKPLEEDNSERNNEKSDVTSSNDRVPEKLTAVMDEQEPEINIVEQSHSHGDQVGKPETAENQDHEMVKEMEKTQTNLNQSQGPTKNDDVLSAEIDKKIEEKKAE